MVSKTDKKRLYIELFKIVSMLLGLLNNYCTFARWVLSSDEKKAKQNEAHLEEPAIIKHNN